MKNLELDFLNIENETESQLQFIKEGSSSIEEALRWMYIQGIADSKCEDFSNREHEEYVVETIDAGSEVLKVRLMTWEEWTGEGVK